MAISLNGTVLSILSVNGTNIEAVNLDGVTVARKPTITTQPVGGTINDNQTHAMSVAADGLGHGLTYQWFMDGNAISGATGTSYTFTPGGNTTNRTFFCRASGFGGGYTQTSTVTVTVNPSFQDTNTLTKASSSQPEGTYWGYNSVIGMGGLSPVNPSGTSAACTSLHAATFLTAGWSLAVLALAAPESSRCTVQYLGSGEFTFNWNATIFGNTQFALVSAPFVSWLQVAGAVPIRFFYYASRDAQENNDPMRDGLDIDEYHKKWGVHEGQRPDLYK